MGENKSDPSLIDLYPYQKRDDGIEVLLLKRSAKKVYSNQWRMIGGKSERREKSWETALRELDEETGLSPILFWSVPSINHFYEPQSDQIHLIPAFAAEIEPGSEIVLDDEHSEYKWVNPDEVGTYIVWPEQKRIIALINQIVTNDQILSDWIIDI